MKAKTARQSFATPLASTGFVLAGASSHASCGKRTAASSSESNEREDLIQNIMRHPRPRRVATVHMQFDDRVGMLKGRSSAVGAVGIPP